MKQEEIDDLLKDYKPREYKIPIFRWRILRRKFVFVFRHRWDEKQKAEAFDLEFKRWELGLWFRHQETVGSRNFEDPNQWSKNLVGTYTIGLNLLICKCWLEFNKGAKTFEL